jgi:hypothetical protein
MSHLITATVCDQCKWPHTMTDVDYGRREAAAACSRCGYYYVARLVERDGKLAEVLPLLEERRGHGVARLMVPRSKGGGGVDRSLPAGDPETVALVRKEYEEAVAAGRIDPETSYLTTVDDKGMPVVIFGKLPEEQDF